MKYAVYRITWAIIFWINLSVVVMSFASPCGARDDFSTSPFLLALIVLCLAAMAANVIVTDIAAEYVCILVGVATLFFRCGGGVPKNKIFPTKRTRGIEEPYIVVYCLKSKQDIDVKDTLSSLDKSWMNNRGYSNALYLLLSGTSNKDLYVEEMDAVKCWNLAHSEDEVVCKYLRRTRSILYKYGQYLDFIMLLNGHDGTGAGDSSGVALFKDTLPDDGSGCFDASTDVNDFKGRLEYDRLVILDRDNVLGENFFTKSNAVYTNSDCDIDIIQPEITPSDMQSRVSDGSDTLYGSITMASHDLGTKMSASRGKFFPAATFFGKGVIRRTKYNKILLGYNPDTYTTEEDTRIPR